MAALSFVEADLRPDSGVGARPSPFSIIEHPFRILVHDEECRLMIVGTASLGPPSDPLRYAQHLCWNALGWMNAVVINRTDLAVEKILSRRFGETDAPTR